MIKNIAIVSLSSGTIGEDFVKHEVDIGIKRLNDFGLNVRFMPHALEGIEYVKTILKSVRLICYKPLVIRRLI